VHESAFCQCTFTNTTSIASVRDFFKTISGFRHEFYENSLLYTYPVEVMKAICDNVTSHGKMNRNNKTTVAANSCSKCTSFSHSYCYIVTRNARSIIKQSVKLQHNSYDIVKAYSN